MAKEIELAAKIRKLKPADGFTVPDESQRQKVCRIAKTLKDAGIVSFDVSTRKNEGGGFRVVAL